MLGHDCLLEELRRALLGAEVDLARLRQVFQFHEQLLGLLEVIAERREQHALARRAHVERVQVVHAAAAVGRAQEQHLVALARDAHRSGLARTEPAGERVALEELGIVDGDQLRAPDAVGRPDRARAEAQAAINAAIDRAKQEAAAQA